MGIGACTVALAATWTTGPLATGIGAAVTTVYGLVADHLRPQHRPSPAAALLWTLDGRIPRLDRLDHPELAGVHPADGHRAQPAPPYVERDAEPVLREALTQGGFVLIVGESTAGKTRLAYEVARSLFPRHSFVRPLARTALATAVEVARRRRRAVLWLDDLENHLGADGLTTSMLAGLLQGRSRRTVVLATMRSEEYRRYDAREESRLTGSDRDAWRAQRDVLDQARKIRLPRHWSPTEQRRAAAYQADARLRVALKSCDRFGLAEVIAAGPELLAAWDHAWAPGANPRGGAIVAAAVDCRRSGLRRPVSRQWLRELHPPYLAERGGPDLQPEPFEEAMQWACRAAYATSGLLIGNYSQGYVAFDYLLSAPGLPPVPDHLWEALLSRAEPADAYDMGLVAHQANQLSRAVAALELARAGGAAGADFLLATAVGDRGRPRQAMSSLEEIVRRRRAELGPCHPDTLSARHQLAFFTGEAGETHVAEAAFRELVADTTAALGPTHTDTLAARHQEAYFTGEAGDTRTAVRQLRTLLGERLRLEGPDHPQVLATRRSLIWFRGLLEDPAGAEREVRELLRDARRHLGPDDPHTLAIVSTQAAFASRAGRTGEALAAFTRLVVDRSRVLGTDHPHVVHSRLQKCQALIAEGRTGEAAEELIRILHDAQRVLEPGHRHINSARSMLDRLRQS
ncbi:tetratricopeptide repeat protein [Streptomyces actuosus]|uniref:Tetratricopeptide repeat protein n=1 Tax=Streptomyces actuosus TaxID=1885 RepID=A0ABS2VJM9_STRAS|nr:tetratricopeptide repeat protein [Streptomyces actuosus]MBN0043314.1 tetratricopeptide repeat protein [Streptomyces actuosus]